MNSEYSESGRSTARFFQSQRVEGWIPAAEQAMRSGAPQRMALRMRAAVSGVSLLGRPGVLFWMTLVFTLSAYHELYKNCTGNLQEQIEQWQISTV